MKKRGVEKVVANAESILGQLVEQAERGAQGIKRDYEARRAVVESDLEIPILERQKYREKIDSMYRAEMQELKAAIDGLIVATRLLIAQLQDEKFVNRLMMDLRSVEPEAVKRAEIDVKRLKGTS